MCFGKFIGKIFGSWKKEGLNPKAFGTALTGIVLIFDVVAYIWHGLFLQPSLITLIYPGFWSSYGLILAWFAGSLISAFILGYLLAAIYNKLNKK